MNELPAAPARRSRARRPVVAALLALVASAAFLTAGAAAEVAPDPRVGLSPGLNDAGVATSGLSLLANAPKPAGFFDPANPGSFSFVNSDLAL